jgi:DnaJ family protein C protein 9
MHSQSMCIYIFSGDCDEENDDMAKRDWNEYWRIIFKPITVKDITDYEKKYKGNHYKQSPARFRW